MEKQIEDACKWLYNRENGDNLRLAGTEQQGKERENRIEEQALRRINRYFPLAYGSVNLPADAKHSRMNGDLIGYGKEKDYR